MGLEKPPESKLPPFRKLIKLQISLLASAPLKGQPKTLEMNTGNMRNIRSRSSSVWLWLASQQTQ